MKKVSFIILSFCIGLVALAQQKAGKVIYLRTTQTQLQIKDNDQLSKMFPKTITEKLELTFGNNLSLLKNVGEDNSEEINKDEDGVQIKMVTQVTKRPNKIVFHNFNTAKKIEQREIMDKKYIITGKISKMKWKLTGETKTILGYVCRKAIAERSGKRIYTVLENGKMEKKEAPETSIIVAWFTDEISVPAGPEMQGQLPGLILELDISNGRFVYKALEISKKVDLTSIKEPREGKKMTQEEFAKENEKMMQKNPMVYERRVIQIQN